MTFLKTVFKSATALSAAFAAFSSFANPVVIPDAPDIAAKGYVLMDYNSGKILAENNMSDKMHPASLTKMLTSYVIGQELKRGNIHRDDQVTISKAAWAKNFPESSKMFIEVGTKVSVADLNKGIIIDSGNDACVAMAEYVAGSQGAFVDLMNSWATNIGMKNSHFANVHGLDNSDLYTTPYDMAILARALIHDVPEEYKIYKQKKFTYNGITQYNRNSLLWDTSLNVDGIKTGHTSNAGYNLVTSATQGNMRLITVVMGTKSANARVAESKKLLTYGFRFFDTVEPHKAGETFIQDRVWMGDKDTIALGVNENTYVTLPRGEAKNLKASFVLEKALEAPINKGDVVGKLYYQLNGKDVAEYPLVALENVDTGGFFSRMWDHIVLFFKGLF